ncbi:hypothetical protein PG913_08765 [Tenacibaculum pacificus]|uniref:hypothetical protein n=1 Tax=Tenacibaculum pacificus TaxID=3018314 RepID=UPI0022F407E3|nr:hypothetical protein [Tenacibaculum pacificus]WBX72985.1 hypothetical protein PG913_08765 [Tenacibaculum pacificus]
MRYYIGAYYLIKLRKSKFGTYEGKELHTCSTCINDSYFDAWSISWTENGKIISQETKTDFNLDENLIERIQKWSDQKFEENKIGWICTFSDLKTLTEYKQSFFPEVEAEILSVNFPETEKGEFLKLFNPEKSSYGEIGLSKNLKNGIIESKTEKTLGFDLIGIESSGEFHSFHCHDLASDLIEKFGIEINEFGLIKENDNWNQMVEYMNDEKNGFEPTPWFYVKIKKVKASA